MKKTILTGCLAITVLFAGSLNAQTYADVEKASDGTPWSIELTSGNVINNFKWGDASLRARYFLSDEIALRLQLGIGDGSGAAMSESYKHYDAINSSLFGTEDIKRSALSFQIGGEYHFLGTQKLDPYAALGINFGFGGQKTSFDKYDGSTYNEYITLEGEGGYSAVGATLGLGADFYFVENVYLGVEAGLGFHAFNYKDSERTVTNSFAGTTTTTITERGHKESHIGLHAAVRLGWRF